MYDTRPNQVIGFHGCDLSRRESLLNNSGPIEKSEKPYDWLGHGVYFWENNFARASEWAEDKARRGEIKEPAVIGAVLNLGICCDLLDSSYINLVSKYYQVMRRNYEALGKAIPKNRDAKGDPNQDKLIRELDCAVIELSRFLPTTKSRLMKMAVLPILNFLIQQEVFSPRAVKRLKDPQSKPKTTFKSASETSIVFRASFCPGLIPILWLHFAKNTKGKKQRPAKHNFRRCREQFFRS